MEYLIQAFNKLNRPDLKLVITNSPHPRFPDHAGKLKNLARNGNITFVDYVLEEDLPAFFSNSSIVVFPYTLTTGTSGAFHTAASYGKATIMSDLPLFRELIEEGAGGLLFPAKDADSLADQISCLVSDPDQARKIGKQNLDFAKSRAWNIVARKYLLVYRHVVDRNWEGFGFQVEPRQNVQIECWV